MHLECLRVRANFPREKIILESEGPAPLLVAEHGGYLILKVEDLKIGEPAATAEESGFFLELGLTPPDSLARKITDFAAEQNLILSPPGPAPPVCRISPILAACHLPGLHKFIFAEESVLEAALSGPGTAGLTVRGEFGARTVPSREVDLVIHLTPPDLARLLSHLLALARTPR